MPVGRIRRGAKIPRGAVLKPRKPPRREKADLIVRLHVEAVQVGTHRCTVTVFNEGNQPAFSTRVSVYRQPWIHNFDAVPALALAGTTTVSIGALERKNVTVSTGQANPFLSSVYAVAFDPLADPFPVNRINELAWLERDLLHHDPVVWRQLAHKDADTYFTNSGLVEVQDGQRSWTLQPRADFGDDVPNEPRIERIYYPGEPPSLSASRSGDRSELRQDIFLGDLAGGALALQEAGKGNLLATATCELFNYDQNPRDRGVLALALERVDAGTISAVAQQPERPDGQSHTVWTRRKATIAGAGGFNQVVVRLLSERRTGDNSNSYFGNVTCTLAHRQVKRTFPALLHRLIPARFQP
jgi:hypothetical protein